MTFEDMVKEFQGTLKTKQEPYLYRALILEEVEEFNSSLLRNLPDEEIFKELLDILYVTVGFGVAMGWDVTEGFKRVHENNMGRMTQPDGTVMYREDGKVIKNKDYPKVKLGDIL